MRNAWNILFLLFVVLKTNAAVIQNFSDNDTITVELSSTNYNRLFVANDIISKVRVPEGTLVVEYDPEGSVYLDLLKTEPLTVFISTKGGHNVTMTIKPVESLGHTVQLTPKTATVQAREFEKKAPKEETVTKLIQAMMNNQMPIGYGVKSVFSSYRSFNKDLTFKVSKQFVGDAYLGEVLTIYNRSKTPVKLDEAWFKGEDTRAIALSKQIIAPKGSETIYVVKEATHA